jgi:hypothetical protein
VEDKAFISPMFSEGVLSGYDYTEGAGRSLTAGQLQRAIWALEDEITLTAGDVLASGWVTEATAAVSGGSWSGLGQVRVLNLWSSSTGQDVGRQAQDQLVIIDVPGGGEPPPGVPLPAVVWVGGALLGAMGLRRPGRRRD